MGYMGHMFLCLSPDLAKLSQDKYRSVPIKLRPFCMKYHFSLFFFLGGGGGHSLDLFLIKCIHGGFF